MKEKFLEERIFSLDRERDSSSSSSSSAVPCAQRNGLKMENMNTHSLVEKIEQEFPGIFEKKNQEKYIKGSFFAKHSVIIQAMSELIVFTGNTLYKFLQILDLNEKIEKKQVYAICKRMYLWGYLSLEVIKTGYKNPANIYYIHTDPAHEKILELTRNQYHTAAISEKRSRRLKAISEKRLRRLNNAQKKAIEHVLKHFMDDKMEVL